MEISFPRWELTDDAPFYHGGWHFWPSREGVICERLWDKTVWDVKAQKTPPVSSDCCPACFVAVDRSLADQLLVIMPDGSYELTERGRQVLVTELSQRVAEKSRQALAAKRR